jgi:pimeloyl-ACP methyl ester carboxylesterase
VIRYDHRDTGRSTTVDFSTDPYTLSDVAADAVGVLDAYSVPAAHVIGFSGGGMVAQTVALEHPERVRTLTSWGSTPLAASFVAPDGGGSGLPGPAPEVMEALLWTLQPAADDDERADRFIGMLRAYAGMLEPFDEEEARDIVKRMFAQTQSPAAFVNHHLAWAASPDRTEMLAKVEAPTLVIHGTADPVVPLVHAEATAKAIRGARLLTIDGMGHDFPRPALPQIVTAILEHTALVGARKAGV